MDRFGKSLILIGLFLCLIGLFIILSKKLGMGKLPGDIMIKKNNTTIFFPLTTCLLISILFTLISKIFK